MPGKSAPATADLQDMVAGLDVQPVKQALVLGRLGFGQRLIGAREDCRGVSPGRIQPQRIEAVAQIIVIGDVALGAPAIVLAQAMAQLGEYAKHPLVMRQPRRHRVVVQ